MLAVVLISIKIVLNIQNNLFVYYLYDFHEQAVPKNFKNSHIRAAGQMAGNIIPKRSPSQTFSFKSCKLFQRRLTASWLSASDFWQRFRRIVSNTCLELP